MDNFWQTRGRSRWQKLVLEYSNIGIEKLKQKQRKTTLAKLDNLNRPCLETSAVKRYLKLFDLQSLLCLLFISLPLTDTTLQVRREDKHYYGQRTAINQSRRWIQLYVRNVRPSRLENCHVMTNSYVDDCPTPSVHSWSHRSNKCQSSKDVYCIYVFWIYETQHFYTEEETSSVCESECVKLILVSDFYTPLLFTARNQKHIFKITWSAVPDQHSGIFYFWIATVLAVRKIESRHRLH